MTSDDIEALLRAIGDDNGTNIEEIDCIPTSMAGGTSASRPTEIPSHQRISEKMRKKNSSFR